MSRQNYGQNSYNGQPIYNGQQQNHYESSQKKVNISQVSIYKNPDHVSLNKQFGGSLQQNFDNMGPMSYQSEEQIEERPTLKYNLLMDDQRPTVQYNQAYTEQTPKVYPLSVIGQSQPSPFDQTPTLASVLLPQAIGDDHFTQKSNQFSHHSNTVHFKDNSVRNSQNNENSLFTLMPNNYHAQKFQNQPSQNIPQRDISPHKILQQIQSHNSQVPLNKNDIYEPTPQFQVRNLQNTLQPLLNPQIQNHNQSQLYHNSTYFPKNNTQNLSHMIEKPKQSINDARTRSKSKGFSQVQQPTFKRNASPKRDRSVGKNSATRFQTSQSFYNPQITQDRINIHQYPVQRTSKSPIRDLSATRKTQMLSSIKDNINNQFEQQVQLLNQGTLKQMQEVQQQHKETLKQSQIVFQNQSRDHLRISEDKNDSLERQFNQLNNMIMSPREDSKNVSNMSFLNNSFANRQRQNQQSKNLRDLSTNTIQYLTDSRPSSQSKMKNNIINIQEDFLNQSTLSGVYNLEDNPSKTREFYKEFSNIIVRNTKQDQINLHDVLYDLKFIGANIKQNQQLQEREGLDNTAISTEVVQNMRGKLFVQVKLDGNHYSGEKDEVTKNLFKILCGIMNLRLMQRGLNPLDDKILKQFLDTINVNLPDQDSIIINQMATIKSLINRKAFYLNEKHLSLINQKFKNFYGQRTKTENERQYEQFLPPHSDLKVPIQFQPNRVSIQSSNATVIVDQKSDIEAKNSFKVSFKEGQKTLPPELLHHEIEEQRESRQKHRNEFAPQLPTQNQEKQRMKSRSRSTAKNDDKSKIGKGSHLASKSPSKINKETVLTQNSIQDFLNSMQPINMSQNNQKVNQGKTNSQTRKRPHFDIEQNSEH